MANKKLVPWDEMITEWAWMLMAGIVRGESLRDLVIQLYNSISAWNTQVALSQKGDRQ